MTPQGDSTGSQAQAQQGDPDTQQSDTDGNLAGKYQSVEELEKGYKQLQAEYTRTKQAQKQQEQQIQQMRQEFNQMKQAQQQNQQAQQQNQHDPEDFAHEFVNNPQGVVGEMAKKAIEEQLAPLMQRIQQQNAQLQALQATNNHPELRESEEAVEMAKQAFQKYPWLQDLAGHEQVNALEVGYNLEKGQQAMQAKSQLAQENKQLREELQQLKKQQQASAAMPASLGGQGGPPKERPESHADGYTKALQDLERQGENIPLAWKSALRNMGAET